MKVNGQAVKTDDLGPAAQDQTAKALEKPQDTPVALEPPPEQPVNVVAIEQEQSSAEKSLADRLNEICNSAWNICQDKSNWSPAVTEHELLRIAKLMDAMRSSFQSLSKIAKKASERQERMKPKAAAGRVAA